MRNFKVPQRFNHFVGGPKAKDDVIDPLFYVDGRPVRGFIANGGYVDYSFWSAQKKRKRL
jgi:hypothetical protein